MDTVHAQDLGSFPFNIHVPFLSSILEQCCPIELPMVIEIFYVYAVQ